MIKRESLLKRDTDTPPPSYFGGHPSARSGGEANSRSVSNPVVVNDVEIYIGAEERTLFFLFLRKPPSPPSERDAVSGRHAAKKVQSHPSNGAIYQLRRHGQAGWQSTDLSISEQR